MVLTLKRYSLHEQLDLPGYVAEIASLHVASDIEPPRGVLTLDLVGRWHDLHVGHVAEPDLHAACRIDGERLNGRHVGPHRGHTPDDYIEPFLPFVRLAHLQALEQSGRSQADVTSVDAEPLGGFGPQA